MARSSAAPTSCAAPSAKSFPLDQFRDLPRRLLPARPGVLRPQAQRGQRRGQSRRHRRQPQLELRQSRGRRTIRSSRRCGRGRCATSPALTLLAHGTPMLLAGRRIRRTRASATTTRGARTTRSTTSTGRRRRRTRDCCVSRAAPGGLHPRPAHPAGRPLLGGHEPRRPRRHLVARRRDRAPGLEPAFAHPGLHAGAPLGNGTGPRDDQFRARRDSISRCPPRTAASPGNWSSTRRGPSPADIREPGVALPVTAATVHVAPFSVVVLTCRPAAR